MAAPAGPEAEAHLLSDPDVASLETIARRVQAAALQHARSVATAESCTGGLIGHAITQIAGSSGYYRGGIISYADEAKIALLGVPAAMIEQHGAVSAQVAVAMAEGVRERLGTDHGVAVTGIAGPGGGTEAKPVGLTYVAIAGGGGQDVRRSVWQGDRSANKLASARAALELLLSALEEEG